MNTVSVNIELPAAPPVNYEITIGSELLSSSGEWARNSVRTRAVRVALISNETVYSLYGEQVADSLARSGFHVHKHLIGDGEQFKNWDTARTTLTSLADNGFTRSDAVVALGGGVVGDLAGFVSAIYMRGISFLQIPTTLLAMIDSSVGGKTAVNADLGKNLIGAFHQPVAVLADTTTLATLPVRELTAGLCEAVKHGAIGGSGMLDTIKGLSARNPSGLRVTPADQDLWSKFVAEQVEFKASVVMGDAGEAVDRVDRQSRKILNFGHTLAHALENVTGYTYFKHGEAVGYGILFSADLSKYLALCGQEVVELLNDVVQGLGRLPALSNIDPEEVLTTFKQDKKNVAGALQLILLKDIGHPVIISEQNIPPTAIRQVLEQFLLKWA